MISSFSDQGLAFDENSLKSVMFNPCPTNLYICSAMLKNGSGGAMIRDLGGGVSLVMAKSVEMIGDGYSTAHDRLERVAFETDSVLQRIGSAAFVTGI
jgi:hypothetical protein